MEGTNAEPSFTKKIKKSVSLSCPCNETYNRCTVYVPLKGTIVTLHHLGGGKVVFNVGQFVCLQLENPSLFIFKRGFEIFYIHIIPIFTKNRTINNFGEAD
jgi:hypothetical protein